MTESEREETFYDAFYGFAKSSVSPRKARPADNYLKVDIFEGQLLRFMKQHDYHDVSNGGLDFMEKGRNPSRSIWVCRFYDDDVLNKRVRDITEHAEELKKLVTETVPDQLETHGVDLGESRKDYRVILIAHSMGGLVCRTFIQNLVRGQASRWVEKFVTLGTPHGGIELDAVPEPALRLIQRTLNPANSRIFDPKYIQTYLKIKKMPGDEKLKDSEIAKRLDESFDPKRCLCVIGSNYQAYGTVKHATGSYSDGLVKQDNAYIQDAYRAYVHQPHSGTTGIVNCFESYENIQRFLFGDVRVQLNLADIEIHTKREPNTQYFYDFECLVAIRNMGVYIHRRENDPCENSIRRMETDIENPLVLHIGFLNTELKPEDSKHSHFVIALRVKESKVKEGWLWDREYPDIGIFQQSVEFRLGDLDPDQPGLELEYRWLERSSTDEWIKISPEKSQKWTCVLDLSGVTPSPALTGKLVISAEPWNNWNGHA